MNQIGGHRLRFILSRTVYESKCDVSFFKCDFVGETSRRRNVQGANRPGGESSRGRIVQGANWSLGETSRGRNVQEANRLHRGRNVLRANWSGGETSGNLR